MTSRVLPLLLLLTALPCGAAVVPVGVELAVKDGRPNNEHTPAVAFAADGHGLIVWTDSRDGVRGRAIAADGSLAPQDVLLVSNDRLARLPGEGTEVFRKDPALLMFADGTFWLFWTEETQYSVITFFDERHDVLGRDVRGQHFDTALQPLGPSVRLNAGAAGYQSRPQAEVLACQPAGCVPARFVVAWENDDLAPTSGAGEGIVGQLLDREGAALSPVLRLSPPAPATNLALARGPEGGLIAAWETPAAEKQRSVLRARFFDAALYPLGKSFDLSPRTPGSQRHVSLVWNAAAGEATAVFDRTMPSNGRYRVMGQRFAAPGQSVGEPFSVTYGVSDAPSASVLTPTNTVLVLWVRWKGDFPYFLQARELSGKVASPGVEFPVAKWPRFDVTIASAPNGRMLAVWEGWVYGLRQGIAARWLEQVP